MKINFSYKKFYWWLGLFVFTMLAYSNNALNSDEGIVLSIAQGITYGQGLYYDIFEFVAPASFYLIAGIWKIFGISYFIARYLAALAIFLTACGIFKISFALTKNRSAHIVPLLFIISAIYWPIISYHTFNLLFIVWGIYFALNTLSGKNYINPLISGFSLGLAIIFLQHTGLLIFGSIDLFFLLLALKEKSFLRLKQLILFTTPALLIISSLFLFWPPKLLFDSLIVFPFFNYTESAAVPYTLVYVFLFILGVIIYFLKSKKKTEYYFIYYIQLVLLLGSISLADHFHVTKIIFPIYALLPLIIDSIKIKHIYLQSTFFFFSAIVYAFIIAPSLNHLLGLFFYSFIKNDNLIVRAQEICAGSEYIYSGPFLPSFYFELRKKNPSPHYWLITNHHTDKQFKETLAGLQTFQPECAILNYDMVKKYNYNKNNPVDNYLANHYNYIENVNSILFFKKKHDLPAQI